MISEMELDYLPQVILDDLPEHGFAGMSKYELAFLCGALKKYRPKKIVEIGVSAGGTSSVILESLRIAGYECEMYSVDISGNWYMDPTKPTGFMTENYFKLKKATNVKHKLLTGATVANFAKEIGNGVDFVVLDTMHSLPGELLDFISILPYLSEKSTAVFHDVAQPQLGIGHSFGDPMEYASLVTMLTINGEKFIGNDKSRIGRFGNIGAVHMQGNYRIWQDNLFLGLMMPWDYIPDPESLEQYRLRIRFDYGEIYEEKFLAALECNKFSLYRRGGISVPPPLPENQGLRRILEEKKIYVYGAGKISKEISKWLNRNGYDISGYIVSERERGENSLISVDEILKFIDRDSVILLGLDERHHEDVIRKLYAVGAAQYVIPENGVGFRELLEFIRYENLLHGMSKRKIENHNGYFNWIMSAKQKVSVI